MSWNNKNLKYALRKVSVRIKSTWEATYVGFNARLFRAAIDTCRTKSQFISHYPFVKMST